MLDRLTKPIKFNFITAIKISAFVWLFCLLSFSYLMILKSAELNVFIFLPILNGIAAYLVLTYSIINLLEAKIKKLKSKTIKRARLLFITLLIGFLFFVVPIGILWGIGKVTTLATKINSSKTIPVKALSLNEDKLWNFINDWEKKQGYQPYVRNTYLCDTANKFLDFSLYWSADYLDKNLRPYFQNSNYAWNFSINRNLEEDVLNYWVTNDSTKKNLVDYYYYSCIKCKNNNCLQLLYNEPVNNNISNNNPKVTNEEYGIVKQISEYTYTQRIGDEAYMGTPSEILAALNNFRRNNSRGDLAWDNDLASWAQSRAQTLANIKSTDEHAGFNAEVQSKYEEFGKFYSFGENTFHGGRLAAPHLIEWLFASDMPHKENMLGDWNMVGIGSASNDGYNYGVDLIFGRTY